MSLPDCVVWDSYGLNSTVDIYVHHDIHCDTHCTILFTGCACAPLLQWLSAFVLCNNNKWRWWLWTVAAYRQTRCLSRLAWTKGIEAPSLRLSPSHIPRTATKVSACLAVLRHVTQINPIQLGGVLYRIPLYHCIPLKYAYYLAFTHSKDRMGPTVGTVPCFVLDATRPV